ncbi:MAG: ABC transporter permease [Anaeroplasmataceae bacterium]
MQVLWILVKRNTKLFFKDKALFISSLITPLIMLLLFLTFLGNVYRDSFRSVIPDGVVVPDSIVEGFVSGWLFSSLLATCSVTIAFCSNLLMIQDKANTVLPDITIAPVKRETLYLSYFISSAFATLIICYTIVSIGFIYLAFVGWYLSLIDVLLILLDVFLLVLFGTGLSSVINYFLKTEGQMSVVGTLISSVYGFICGAYMPISQFGNVLQKVLMCLPGTYGTSLLHNHYMNGVLSELDGKYFPTEVVNDLSKSFDSTLYFFGHRVENYVSYIVLATSILVILTTYILINKYTKKKVRG